jgi:two-component sensor histidine kinase
VNLEGLEPNPDGFGMELLRRSLAYDVQGDTRVDLQKNGLRFELRMPLDEEDAVDA